jgi:predicted nucleic-acid-binding Zn-ribbon protein
MPGEPPSLNYQSNQPQRPPKPSCSKCGSTMLQGITATDAGLGDVRSFRTIWIEGEMKRGWMGILRPPKGKRFETIAFRCPNCGLVEFYSPAG